MNNEAGGLCIDDYSPLKHGHGDGISAETIIEGGGAGIETAGEG